MNIQPGPADLLPGLRQYRDILRHLQALQAVVSELERREDLLQHAVAELRSIPYISHPEWIGQSTNTQAELRFTKEDRHEGIGRSFEDLFRCSEAEILQRQRFYLPLIRDENPVADIGCGRGEFLKLLQSEGVPAVGVDWDRNMVERCRAQSLEVSQGDGLAWLESLPEGGLGCVFVSHVLEHQEGTSLPRWLAAARRALRPGGILVAETPNPHALFTFKTFWTDPTHRTPLFPEVLLWLCQLEGFSEGRIVFPMGSGTLQKDRFACGEYAVIARKMGAT